MHGRINVVLDGKETSLWFNNYSKVELGKQILGGEGGFTPKPDEILIVNRVNELVKENYLVLLKAIIYAGVIGHAYGTDSAPSHSRKEIAGIVAEMDSDLAYQIWGIFLRAYGFDVFLNDNEEEEAGGSVKGGEKKKTKKTS